MDGCLQRRKQTGKCLLLASTSIKYGSMVSLNRCSGSVSQDHRLQLGRQDYRFDLFRNLSGCCKFFQCRFRRMGKCSHRTSNSDPTLRFKSVAGNYSSSHLITRAMMTRRDPHSTHFCSFFNSRIAIAHMKMRTREWIYLNAAQLSESAKNLLGYIVGVTGTEL